MLRSKFDKLFWDEFGALSLEVPKTELDDIREQKKTANERIKDIKKLISANSLKNIKSIDIDYEFKGRNTSGARNTMLKATPEIINTILGKIDYDDKWMVFYKYNKIWRSRKLDEITGELLRNQADNEIDFQNKTQEILDLTLPGNTAGYMRVNAIHYDFMPVSFQQVNTIRIVNVGKFNNRVDGTHITSSGDIEDSPSLPTIENDPKFAKYMKIPDEDTRKDVLDMYYDTLGIKPNKRVYKIKQGRFWKWLCKIPINLERYMIFNTLDERTIKLMDEDNCLIYACKQFGLSEDIIDHMKEIIKTKSFTLKKLKIIAEDTNIGFDVEDNCRHHRIGNQDGVVVPLMLFKEHYMLNERVKISPFYLRNYYEIEADEVCKRKNLEDRQMVSRKKFKNGKAYYFKEGDIEDYSLKAILNLLFELNAFEPIKMGEYLTYASSLYKYKLDPIETLEYNPSFCCRKKESYVRYVPSR
jgi:hypothetical protein